MTSINILSFLAALVCQYIGVYFHYKGMKREKRVSVSFYTYLFYGSKVSGGAKAFLILMATWTSCTVGGADLINPALLWEMLKNDYNLHIASWGAVFSAIQAGYFFDSVGNKVIK